MKGNQHQHQLGSARLKLIVVIAVIACGVFVAYKAVPVAYQAYLFKDFMQNRVELAAAQGREAIWVRDQLAKSLPDYGIPDDALITPANRNGRVEVRVQYTQRIELPGYAYDYQFDHTVRSTAFLSSK